MVSFIISLASSFAQKKGDALELVHAGNEFFYKEQFYKAAEYYAKALAIDSESAYINYQLGECYRMLFNYGKAESLYRKAGQQDKINYPYALYYYPLMQKLNGNFQAAINNFDHFLAYANENGLTMEEETFFIEKAKIEKEGCEYALEKLASPIGDFKFTNVGAPINSLNNDYAAAIHQNDSSLYFTSGRKGATGNNIDNRFGEVFSDIYRYNFDTTWQRVDENDNFNLVNTEFSDGAGTFNQQKDAFYFTSCHEGGAYCKIYVTNLIEGKWQPPLLLNENINIKNFENKQPVLSPGSDTLFFVSGRPGGQGMNDIWMSISSGGDAWGKAINLGDKINTPYNEIAPFYYEEEKILFFSSDGHKGFGGLDIFMAHGSAFSEAVISNLGDPFNSNYDDAYLVLGTDKGYLSSNRSGGEGKFDIYSFNLVTNEVVIAEVGQLQANAGKDDVLKSRVRKLNQSNLYAVRDEDKFYYESLSSTYKVRVDRIVSAKIEALKSMGHLKLSKEDENYYNSLSIREKAQIEKLVKILWANNRSNISEAIADMVRENPAMANTTLVVTGRLVKIVDGSAAPAITIPLMDAEGNVLKTTSTNDDGSFKYTNLPINQKFKILADNVQTKLTENAAYVVEGLKVEAITREVISITKENIYFDYDSHTIRPEAARVLDEIVAFYMQHPEVQIEIFAYTDDRGTDLYNDVLSQMRGQATLEYLVKKGMDRTALVILAQGRRKPFASNDDEIGRQLNRRVEFSINGDLTSFQTGATTYLLRENCSVGDLSKATGFSIEDLVLWNGFVSEDLKAFSPIRLKNTEEAFKPALLYKVDMQSEMDSRAWGK